MTEIGGGLVVWFCAAWIGIYLFLKTLKFTVNKNLMRRLLSKYELSLSLGFLGLEVPLHSEWFFFLSHPRLRLFLDVWFLCGVGACSVGMVVSFFWLLKTLVVTLVAPSVSEAVTISAAVITPVIPGVNIPIYNIGYLWIAVFCSVAFHEFGHALAAGVQTIRVTSVGVFFALFFPGAYVRMHPNLGYLQPLQQLRVYCGGVWHNLVLCAFVSLLLACFPVVLSPVYGTGAGATIVSVAPDSPFVGHLSAGDIITAVNDMPILSTEEWRAAMVALYHSAQAPPPPSAAAAAAAAEKDTTTTLATGTTTSPTFTAIPTATEGGGARGSSSLGSQPDDPDGAQGGGAGGVATPPHRVWMQTHPSKGYCVEPGGLLTPTPEPVGGGLTGLHQQGHQPSRTSSQPDTDRGGGEEDKGAGDAPPDEVIPSRSTGCCETPDLYPSLQCFHHWVPPDQYDGGGGGGGVNDGGGDLETVRPPGQFCFSAKWVATVASGMCITDQECSSKGAGAGAGAGVDGDGDGDGTAEPQGSLGQEKPLQHSQGSLGPSCLIPAVPAPDLLFRLSFADRPVMVYVGAPSDVFADLGVGDFYLEAWVEWLVPDVLRGGVLDMPRVVQRQLEFMFHVSGAVAMMNVAPVYFLDGQFACRQFVEVGLKLWFVGIVRRYYRDVGDESGAFCASGRDEYASIIAAADRTSSVILFCGSVLLFATVCIAFSSLI